MGLVLPATTTLAQQAGDRARGTASSLQGGLGMLTGALATPLTGIFGYASLLPMAVLMAAGFGTAALTLIAVSRPRRDRRPAPRLPEASTAWGGGSHLARRPAADMPAGCGQSAGSLDK